MTRNYLWFAPIVLSLILFGCGKKQKKIFAFKYQGRKKKNVSLGLPSIKNVQARLEDDGNVRVTWRHAQKNTYACIGYNIYRLTLWGVVSRKPINNSVCTDNWFIDHGINQAHMRSYVVRGVFNHEGNMIAGPMSKIAMVEVKK